MFIAAGVWMCGGHYISGDQFEWAKLAGGLIVLACCVLFAFKTKTSYETFRMAALGAAGGAGAYMIVKGGIGLANAASLNWRVQETMPAVGEIVFALIIFTAYWYVFVNKNNFRQVIENIFTIPELLGKLLFTIALLAIYRVGFAIPLPGINQDAIRSLFQGKGGGLFGEAMEYYGMFTGGSLSQSSLFGLGIMPYITASIIFMLLAQVVPAIEKLQKEGPAGQKKIHEYTRYSTVALCIFQAIMFLKWISTQTLPGGLSMVYPSWQGSWLLFTTWVICLTAGTMFLMWLGEQIDEYGIGNGISLLIMAGIVARLPYAIRELFAKSSFQLGDSGDIGPMKIIVLALSFVFVVAGAILITQGQRRIPIQQAKLTRGRRVYGGQRHYIPLRVNHGGVMPIIFASSLMMIVGLVGDWIGRLFGNGTGFWASFFQAIPESFRPGAFVYTILEVLMIYFFAYFWTTVQFRPKDMSDQLRDMGHFIPGLRPGKRTADYLETVMERITYCGAAFLAIIAVLPALVASKMGIPFQVSAFLGGTGLLILVSVVLDLIQRIEAQLVMRNYGGFLGGSTRIKGAYA